MQLTSIRGVGSWPSPPEMFQLSLWLRKLNANALFFSFSAAHVRLVQGRHSQYRTLPSKTPWLKHSCRHCYAAMLRCTIKWKLSGQLSSSTRKHDGTKTLQKTIAILCPYCVWNNSMNGAPKDAAKVKQVQGFRRVCWHTGELETLKKVDEATHHILCYPCLQNASFYNKELLS